MMIRAISVLAFSLAVCGAAGCRATRGEALRLGLSQKTVSSHFKGSGTHQFSARWRSSLFRCVSYSFGKRTIRYYFLFEDDRLVSMLDTRPFFANAFTSKPHPRRPGATVSVRKPWKAENFMAAILEAQTLSPEVFSLQLAARLKEEKGREESYGALPAFVLLAPLIIPHAIVRNMIERTWSRKYDPFKIEDGATRTEAEATYGKPQFIVRREGSNRETHAYGPSELLRRGEDRLSLGPANKKSWLAVVYEDDIAVRVFSNDLFNDMTIVNSKYEVE